MRMDGEQGRQLVQDWRASGESQAGYCRSRGIAPARLAYWMRRMGGPQGRKRRGSPCSGFVQVLPVEDANRSTGGGWRVRLVSGLVVETGPEVGVGEVVTLVRGLNRC